LIEPEGEFRDDDKFPEFESSSDDFFAKGSGKATRLSSGNPGGEPHPGSSYPNEEHRASASIRRRGRKRVLNAKISIYVKRDACKI
jgi:hypothetical protein